MALFKSKIGLIAATVGSAVGLGTVWRFPAETQANGGAAFLIVYIFCLFLLGVPVMLAEFTLGRTGRTDAFSIYNKLTPKSRWPLVGIATLVVAFMILTFYMVVGGWTTEYLMNSINGDLFTLSPNTTEAQSELFFVQKMHQYINTPVAPAAFTAIFIGLNILVLLGGVQKGIERMANIMMPLLFVLLVGFCVVSLTLPNAGGGVEFFLKPDFSKITPQVFISALGQALFSLSLGMGILITYASYFPDSTKLGKTAITVVSLTLLVAILMGLLIFPAVSSFNMQEHGLSGTTLVFVTLPEVFNMLPMPRFWATLFFVLLVVAALTSTVSLSEVPIRFMQDRYGMRRRTAVLTVLLPLVVLSTVCSLSFSSLSHFKVLGMSMFNFLDTVSNDYMLPLVALATCIYAGWFAPKGMMEKQLNNNGQLHSWLTRPVIFIVRYIAPLAILSILAGFMYF